MKSKQLVKVKKSVAKSLVSAGINVPGEKKPKEQEQPEIPTDVPEKI